MVYIQELTRAALCTWQRLQVERRLFENAYWPGIFVGRDCFDQELLYSQIVSTSNRRASGLSQPAAAVGRDCLNQETS